jgi:glutamate racemase
VVPGPQSPSLPGDHPYNGSMGDARPVGVFDSGLGGITVLREIRKQLPGENCVYVADSSAAPYGSKPPAAILDRAVRVTEFLIGNDAKAIVVACNSASVVGLHELRARYAVPFIGVVPAVKPAAGTTRTGTIGVLTTPATADSDPLAKLIEDFAFGAKVVTQMCPGLVPMVERGEIAGPAVEELLRFYLTPVLDAGADVIVLGCTHYPFLREAIARICGPDVLLIDPAAAVARQLGRVLTEQKLLHAQAQGTTTYYTTGEPADFIQALTSMGVPPESPVSHADI